MYVAEALAVVVLVVVAVAAVVGLANALRFRGRTYSEVGGGQFALDPESRSPSFSEPAQLAEAEAEIRQLVEAKSARRAARGEPPLDIEREVSAHMDRLRGPAQDDLREEVRQLVMARNERRRARGQEPLDVETEVDRELARLSQGGAGAGD